MAKSGRADILEGLFWTGIFQNLAKTLMLSIKRVEKTHHLINLCLKQECQTTQVVLYNTFSISSFCDQACPKALPLTVWVSLLVCD